jgi:putative flippase GtrA
MKFELKSVFTVRFFKFCLVGSSGVIVNLFFLYMFSDFLGLHVNLASALAIEISVNSNFIINEIWTFSDRRIGAAGGIWKRCLKFHLISLGGAAIQWSVFVAANVCWTIVFQSDSAGEVAPMGDGSWVDTYVWKPIADPPQVGNFKYLSQLLGIGAATLWNYFANFYWTWGVKRTKGKS